MLVDHSACVFEAQLSSVHPWLYAGCRIFGRLAFPLFAFGVAEGAAHTSSPKKYLTRMFVFALISQIPFSLMVGTRNASFTVPLLGMSVPVYASLSVMATLFLGLAVCLSLRENKPFWGAFAIAAAVILDRTVGMDYGLLGVLFVFALYLSRNTKPGLIFTMLAFAVCFYLAPVRQLIAKLAAGGSEAELTVSLMKCAAMASASVFVLLYNRREGKKAKLYFYFFYPVHMLLLWGLWMIDRSI